MKLSQAVKLGHQSLVGHKRRSLSVIITMGVLFGLLLGINLVVQGLENAILGAATNASGGEYYIEVHTNHLICPNDTYVDEDGTPHFAGSICPELDLIADITPFVEQYHGQIIATDYNILKVADATPFIQYDLSQLPDGVLPVLTNLGNALYLHGMTIKGNTIPYPSNAAVLEEIAPTLLGQVLHNSAGNYDYAIVGILPSNDLQSLTLKRRVDDLFVNPLDLVLDLMPRGGNTSSGVVYVGGNSALYNTILLDDGTQDLSALRLYFTGLFQSYYQNFRSALVKFNDYQDALNFANHWPDPTINSQLSGIKFDEQQTYSTSQAFTNQINVIAAFNLVKWLLGFAEIVIVVIALIVAIFTCLKVISTEDRTIQLYRSLGASRGNICLIYGWYLLELCLLAAGFALLGGILIGLVTSALNGLSLTQMLTAAYAREIAYPIILLGWNWQITQILAFILLTAPVCLLLMLPKLTRK